MARCEILIGTILGLALSPYLGWWVCLVAPITGILYVLGGYQGYVKNWRRIGVPLVIGLSLYVATGSLGAIASGVLLWAMMTVGYGVDSPLGMLIRKLGVVDTYWQEFWIRSTVAIGLGCCYIPMVGVSGWKFMVAFMVTTYGYMAAVLNDGRS